VGREGKRNSEYSQSISYRTIFLPEYSCGRVFQKWASTLAVAMVPSSVTLSMVADGSYGSTTTRFFTFKVSAKRIDVRRNGKKHLQVESKKEGKKREENEKRRRKRV
jgi:hypothetical protein